MAKLIQLPEFTNDTGSLTVIEKVLPFDIRRVYFIYHVSRKRGGHRHRKTTQALICLNGSCEIYINNGVSENTVMLDTPQKCLILEPQDWHTIDKFSKNSILLVCASEFYDVNDYIDEPYP